MWFIRLGGRETGPFTEERLRAMLKLNQFSSLYQISRDKTRWESATTLVQSLNGAIAAANSTISSDKWLAAAKLRQSNRAVADATTVRKPQPNAAQSPIVPRNIHAGASVSQPVSAVSKPADSVSVQILHASKSVTDQATGKPRVLLHPVTISLSLGELTAVIGPSGSGKSTWLGLLTGRSQPTTGRITVFGRDLNRDFSIVKRSMGAVPQMDAFLTSLKVRTSLYYSACLRLATETAASQISARVESVLKSVELDECGNRRISQLSGGQLRRLSLAQELLSDPDVLYLDEVTSGLDEQSDGAIMELLRRLAASGRTIMIITHHLHNLQGNCQKLVVLATGGYLLFFGSPAEACRSFKVGNVTEVLPAVRAMNQAEIVSRCEAASGARSLTPPAPVDSPVQNPVSVPRQSRHLADFFVLTRRQVAVLFSSPLSVLMSLFICATIGLLLLISYPDLSQPGEPKEQTTKAQEGYVDKLKKCVADNGNVVFILTISSFFLGCLAGTRELVMERRLFWRESGTEMSIRSYLLSKLFVQALFTCAQASCLGVVVVILIKAECSPAGVAVASSAVAISGLCTGFFISAASRSEAVATKTMLLAVLPQMILSGALQEKPPAAIKLLSQVIITSHYGFQNMCGLFPEQIRPPFRPTYSTAVVIAISFLHSLAMLGATAFFLNRTAKGEDPARVE